MTACSLVTPGMAVGVELNPAPGDGVGEGDGLDAARTTIAAVRFMRAVLSRSWRRSGWRPARRPPPGGSVGRVRPAARSAAGTPARRAPPSSAGRRRRAGRGPRPAAVAAGPAGRRPSPPPAAAARPGRSRTGTARRGRAPRPGRASWSGTPPRPHWSARAPGWARPGRRSPRTPGPRLTGRPRRPPPPPCRAARTAGPAARPRTRRGRRRTATPAGPRPPPIAAAPAAAAVAAAGRTRRPAAPPVPAPGTPAGSAALRGPPSLPPSSTSLAARLGAGQPPAAVHRREGREHHLTLRIPAPAVPADRAHHRDHLPVRRGGVRRVVVAGQRRADLDPGAVRRPGVPLGPRRPDRRVGADLAGEGRGEPPDRPARRVVRVGVQRGVRLLQRAHGH